MSSYRLVGFIVGMVTQNPYVLMIASSVGGAMDQINDVKDKNKLNDSFVTTSSTGAYITRTWGKVRIPGNIIMASQKRDQWLNDDWSDAIFSIFGGDPPEQHVLADLAIGVADNPGVITNIIANKKSIYSRKNFSMSTVKYDPNLGYIGSTTIDNDQDIPDSDIIFYNALTKNKKNQWAINHYGAQYVPRYNKTNYIMITNADFYKTYNNTPNYEFEIVNNYTSNYIYAEPFKIPFDIPGYIENINNNSSKDSITCPTINTFNSLKLYKIFYKNLTDKNNGNNQIIVPIEIFRDGTYKVIDSEKYSYDGNTNHKILMASRSSSNVNTFLFTRIDNVTSDREYSIYYLKTIRDDDNSNGNFYLKPDTIKLNRYDKDFNPGLNSNIVFNQVGDVCLISSNLSSSGVYRKIDLFKGYKYISSITTDYTVESIAYGLGNTYTFDKINGVVYQYTNDSVGLPIESSKTTILNIKTTNSLNGTSISNKGKIKEIVVNNGILCFVGYIGNSPSNTNYGVYEVEENNLSMRFQGNYLTMDAAKKNFIANDTFISFMHDSTINLSSNDFVCSTLDVDFEVNVSVASIINDIMSERGISQDLYEIDPDLALINVKGFFVKSLADVRSILEELQKTFLFDIMSDGTKLKFIKRGMEPILTIDDSEFIPMTQDDLYKVSIKQDEELPKVVTANYYDPSRDGNRNTIYSKVEDDSTINNKNNVEIMINSYIEPEQVKAICDILLWESRIGKTTIEFKTSFKYLFLMPSDVINIVTNGSENEYKIIEKDIKDGEILFKAISNDHLLYRNQDEKIGYQTDFYTSMSFEESIMAKTGLEIFDTSIMKDYDDNIGYYAGLWKQGSGTWPGARLYKVKDNEKTLIGGSNKEVIYGVCKNTLGNYKGNSIDLENYIEVDIGSEKKLLDISISDILSSTKNICLVGQEYIQFKNCKKLDNGNWLLYNLSRGKFGTFDKISTHASLERILINTENAILVKKVNSEINSNAYFKAETGTELVSIKDLTIFNNKNNQALCLPVSNVGFIQDTSNVKITWKRSNRIKNSWEDYSDIPNTDGSNFKIEIYKVNTNNTNTLIGTFTSTTEYIDLTKNELNILSPGLSKIRVKIYHVNSENRDSNSYFSEFLIT